MIRHSLSHLGAIIALTSSMPMMASVRRDEDVCTTSHDEAEKAAPPVSRQVRRQMERKARKGGVA